MPLSTPGQTAGLNVLDDERNVTVFCYVFNSRAAVIHSLENRRQCSKPPAFPQRATSSPTTSGLKTSALASTATCRARSRCGNRRSQANPAASATMALQATVLRAIQVLTAPIRSPFVSPSTSRGTGCRPSSASFRAKAPMALGWPPSTRRHTAFGLQRSRLELSASMTPSSTRHGAPIGVASWTWTGSPT